MLRTTLAAMLLASTITANATELDNASTVMPCDNTVECLLDAAGIQYFARAVATDNETGVKYNIVMLINNDDVALMNQTCEILAGLPNTTYLLVGDHLEECGI